MSNITLLTHNISTAINTPVLLCALGYRFLHVSQNFSYNIIYMSC